VAGLSASSGTAQNSRLCLDLAVGLEARRQAGPLPTWQRHLLPNKVLSPSLEQLLTKPAGVWVEGGGRRGWGQL
jgi:hypothetical protein